MDDITMNSGDQTPREPKSTGYLVTVMRDLASVGCLGILLLCIHELASPFTRGFYCEDETIRYPHKESTVPSSVCYLIGSGLNVLLILVMEYYLLIKEPHNSNGRESVNRFQVQVYIRNVYCRLIVWLFGAISSELLTDISKVTAGRLRPHFIEVCKPVIVVPPSTEIGLDEYCQQTANKYQYITNYQCSGKRGMQRDARLSFMSGHSSYSAYSAAFATFYLQSTMDVAKLGLIKPAFQVLIISTAFYTGLTRVSDYKHHWQDVLAGLLQGTSVATVVSLYVWPPLYRTYSRYFNNKSPRVGNDHVCEELNPVSY